MNRKKEVEIAQPLSQRNTAPHMAVFFIAHSSDKIEALAHSKNLALRKAVILPIRTVQRQNRHPGFKGKVFSIRGILHKFPFQYIFP
jgi:hypothetical protein